MEGFQLMTEACYQIFQNASLQIMAALEVGLNLRSGTLTDRCHPASSELRLNHYPNISRDVLAEGKIKRTWPHTDFGIITLLFQDSIGGLEIEDRTKPGAFLPVLPPDLNGPLEMAVNASDTLQRWTNSRLTAGLHQVPTPSQTQVNSLPDRYLLVFFVKAHRKTLVGPLPEFVTADRLAAYDEINALQFQQRMTKVLYTWASPEGKVAG